MSERFGATSVDHARAIQQVASVYDGPIIWGEELLETDNYQNDWAGTFNGANLPDGTYYYVIETETGKIYKGAITILRGK